MTKAEMKMVGNECVNLARGLADYQDDELTVLASPRWWIVRLLTLTRKPAGPVITPLGVQRLVNALINSGNCFKDIAAGKIDPVAGGFVEKSETPAA